MPQAQKANAIGTGGRVCKISIPLNTQRVQKEEAQEDIKKTRITNSDRYNNIIGFRKSLAYEDQQEIH